MGRGDSTSPHRANVRTCVRSSLDVNVRHWLVEEACGECRAVLLPATSPTSKDSEDGEDEDATSRSASDYSNRSPPQDRRDRGDRRGDRWGG